MNSWINSLDGRAAALVTGASPEGAPPGYLLENVLCCPLCKNAPLISEPPSLACDACRWRSVTVEGDTQSFASTVYGGPRTRTRRMTSAIPDDRRRRFRSFVYRWLPPWRPWVLGDAAYWNSVIGDLRNEELRTVQKLLEGALGFRRPVLLELGVGFQNHVSLYRQFAEHAIFSDIYRDPGAVHTYGNLPGAYYCLVNVEQLPLRPSSVDVLLTSHVVEHFPDHVANLTALHRSLKPDAIAVHVVPIATGFLLGHLVATLANLLTLTPFIGRGTHGEYDSVWQELAQTTKTAWRALFTQCGFELLGEGPGTLGIAPVRPSVSLWLANHAHIFGSWVFAMRTIK